MYSIVSVIYGIPFTSEMDKILEQHGMCTDEVDFEFFYHGSSPWSVGFCGVQLDEFDECRNSLLMSNIKRTPTQEQKEKVQARVDALPDFVRGSDPIGVYFIFSTS